MEEKIIRYFEKYKYKILNHDDSLYIHHGNDNTCSIKYKDNYIFSTPVAKIDIGPTPQFKDWLRRFVREVDQLNTDKNRSAVDKYLDNAL